MDKTPYSDALKYFFEEEQKELVNDSFKLIEYFAQRHSELPVHDFAFIVFPIARAYEGFLKTFFYRANLITEAVYTGRHFRVGRSFNPDLPEKFRDEFWLYDNVQQACSADLAHRMWQAWLDGRNHLFHYYPHNKYELTYVDAVQICERIVQAMEDAVRCPLAKK